MTDTATQLARYKRLAQEQAETIRRLREELEPAVRTVSWHDPTKPGSVDWDKMPRRVWNMKEDNE